jgi:peptidoglycan/LPS O-acetylase OafA/YrhL
MERSNNFNLIRLVAALAVIVSHSWPLALGRTVTDPFVAVLGFSLGAAAVKVFFAISGYLIYQSFERSSLVEFFAARALRLLPALFVVAVLTVLVIGPIFTTAPDYFGLHALAFVPLSLTLPADPPQLPGLFWDNPHPGANGTQWTLHYEAVWYVLVALTAPLSRRLFPLFVAAAVLLHMLAPSDYTVLGLPFLVGMTVARYRLPLDWRIAVTLGVVTLACYAAGTLPVEAAAIAIGYTAIWAGAQTTPYLSGFNRLGDYSYGVYLWGWPVQQVIVSLTSVSPWQMMVLAIPVSVALGALSWFLVEKPALQWRKAFKPQPALRGRILQHVE